MHLTALVAALAAALGAQAGVPPQPPCACKAHVLDCSNHSLTALSQPVSCADATTVNLGENLLQVFPSGLMSFETVKAGGNKLTRLPMASQLSTELKNLELNDNQIAQSSDEFRTLSSLRRLRLENNNLTSLGFLPEECNLYSLDVSANDISNISGPLKGCTALTFLSLTDNEITNLPSDVFSRMEKLKYLYLNNNKIIYIPGGSFVGLNDLRDLSFLMNRNMLLFSDSFQGLSQLQNLDLSFTNLQFLPAGIFASTPLLEKLNLVTNNLTALPENVTVDLISIKEIELWNNRLTEVPVLQSCCNGLRTLNLRGNSIVSASEAALRSVLRERIETVVGGALLRPAALKWALGADRVEAFVAGLCSCGGLRRGFSKIEFCVDVVCGKDSSIKDWRDAVRATTSP